MKINVSPKGRNVGYVGKPKKYKNIQDDPSVKNALKYVETVSAMEDSTERAFKQIEALRADTLKKIQV